ncbi:MAG: 16S rRNA (cytidine(1402)-2'-O)-methyltransferase [Candidatus Binataceae bacterium]
MAKNEHTQDGQGVLFVVATPIGNPDDITARALRVLAGADLVACEDTRRTGQLLTAHRLHKPLISYFEHNEERRVPELVARLTEGARIALVTDAGTPAISDPGYRLVRAALDAGIAVRAVPGASAVIAALSIAGIPTDRFVFEGFLPSRGASLRSRVEALAGEYRTMVFFEAGRRLGETLAAMASSFGNDRESAIVREITKTYEETIRGSLEDLSRRFKDHEALGEVTIVVAGAPEAPATSSAAITVEMLMNEGVSLKQASAVVANLTGRSRREVYQEALRKRGEDREPPEE